MTETKFTKLIEVLYKLRKECPWDKVQTHDSLKSATMEEAYEVINAIDEKDFDELKGELGDLLLHIIFHSVIAEEEKHFTLDDVIEGITSKLIRRHTHIFGGVVVKNNSEIERNWETIKLEEEGRESILDGVPKNMPGLHRAFRLQQKASKVGFDWKKKEDVWEKVLEEIDELKEAECNNDLQGIENELGDLFFSLINYSRFLGVNPENAVRKSTNKFVKRFHYIEKKIKESGGKITDSDLEEMDKFWDESKKV